MYFRHDIDLWHFPHCDDRICYILRDLLVQALYRLVGAKDEIKEAHPAGPASRSNASAGNCPSLQGQSIATHYIKTVSSKRENRTALRMKPTGEYSLETDQGCEMSERAKEPVRNNNIEKCVQQDGIYVTP